MKKTILFITCIIITSCGKNPETYVPHLNGYWEIDEVTLADGSKRDYNYNDTIDFMNIGDSLTGFRQKVKPNIDGTYSTSGDIESLRLVIENDNLNIYYKTPFSEWKETVIKATENQLIIKNEDDLIYTYRRYEPLDLD